MFCHRAAPIKDEKMGSAAGNRASRVYQLPLICPLKGTT
ncbi:hypothetical protein CHCC20375_1541 [Bacillus licheniformis]|nr:hypothetical protein CHCC20375_1541 [Bacillus licheniformis]